jgi:hypothetical protein
MANAFDHAGIGPAATYPRERPLAHLDQTFLVPGLAARRYRIIDPGTGNHRMQFAEIVAAP